MTARVRVLLADDHTLVRAGLRKVLEQDGGLTVVGEVADGAAALEFLARQRVDVVVLDLTMPGLDGFELLHNARARWPELKLLVLTMHADPEHAARAVRGDDFVLKARPAYTGTTQWSIVYDIGRKRAMFRTRVNREIRWLDLGALDFACGARALSADMNAPGSGDLAAKLEACTLETNTELVRAAFARTDFLRAVPLEAQQDLARYPERSRCAP